MKGRKHGRLIPLRATDISPEVLLAHIEDELHNFDAMYVIALDKRGEPHFFGSGNLAQLAVCTQVMDILTKRYIEEVSDD